MEAIDKPISVKPRTLIIAFFAFCSVTVPLLLGGALIYYEFRAMQTEITNLKEDNVVTNGRIDKKTKRNSDRIKDLEKSNSDNK